MGKFDFNIDQDLVKQLLKLDNVDEIAPQVIDSAIPVLKRNIKAECRKHRKTGQMEDSVKETKAKKNQYGYYAVVRPTGKSKFYKTEKKGEKTRRVPVRNMEVMAHLEYGTKHQKPTPIMTKGMKESEEEVKTTMQNTFNRIIGG